MGMVLIKTAGQAVPQVEKRASESLVYLLDCKELLDINEIINGVSLANQQDGITISDLRSRQGVMIEVRVDNAPLSDTSQYVDFIVEIEFTTIFRNKKLAVFKVRVYK